ncbi:leucine-rich repeat-containing protein [Heterostelium album PN500]|uniref:Leucine-rich repeat-containing protein n=1 Tax=Heterostelium pallidum (strain ATCC 26659 / Pp 5 / PN500) TaxID=670386 RepID=D3BT04_HETP5|nr:leucine-rich repeat-containing protein [Heterostelium album PN500]EFA75619.1 leucine-rich repeat-containing protein [Heterostelium album PN500]|eukprot:XP_020427753.1 leucine-rich repeat-containing protein [Heterostelium album PN500]
MSQIWSNSVAGSMTNINSAKHVHKLPASPNTQKERAITKIPITGADKITEVSTKDARNLFAKLSFPIFLDLSDSCYNIESDEFLKSCPNVLKEIYICNFNIDILSLKQFYRLNLTSNSLIEVSSIGHQSKLKRLILDKNNIVDVSLKGLNSLIYFSVANNRLASVPDLSDQKDLINIDFSNNRLQDGFEELAKLKSLEVLDLANNNIDYTTIDQFSTKFLEHLRKIKTLEYLALDGNPIEKSIPEFRLFMVNAIPKLKYFNWVAIPKEEKLRASKLEAEGFWKKDQPLVREQPPAPLVQQASQPNISSGAIPPIPMISKPTATFIQRRPNTLGGAGGTGFLIGSHLARSTDRQSSASSDTSRKIDEDLDVQLPSMEYYLNQLIQELPPAENLDFSLMLDRKIYLDALYNAIVDGSLNADLIPEDNAILESSKASAVIVPLDDVIEEEEELLQPVPETVVSVATPVLIEDETLDSPEIIQTAVSTSTSTSTSPSPTPIPQPISTAPIIRMSEEDIMASTSDQIKVISPVLSSDSRSLNHSGSVSPNTTTPLSSSPSFRPINFGAKRPASPLTKPAGSVSRSSSPLTNRATATPSPPPPTGFVAKKLEQLSKGIQGVSSTPTSNHSSKPHTPQPGTPKSDGELDINKFTMEIEKALQDIHDVSNEMTQQNQKQQEQQTTAATPSHPQTILPSLSEENLVEVSNHIPTTNIIPVQMAESEDEAEVSQITSMPVIKPSDDINTAAKKLNEMIDEYNKSEDEQQKIIENTRELTLLDLVQKFEQLRSSIGDAPPKSSTSQPSQIPWQALKSDIQIGSKLGSGSFGESFVGVAWNDPVVLKKLYTMPTNINQFKDRVSKMLDLNHENVVPIKGCYIDKNDCYLISPFVDSCTLETLLSTPRFNFSQEFICNVLLGIAKAMCFLHQHGFKHGTLSPSNILIDQSGVIHIRDYGMFNDQKIEPSKVTPYTAPELVVQESEETHDETIDQYSFGIIVWQIFQRGKQPFNGSSDIVSMLKQGYRPELTLDVPSVFDRLIRACWHQDITARPNFLTITKILGQPIPRLFSLHSKVSTPTTQIITPNTTPTGSPNVKPMSIPNKNISNLTPLSSPKLGPLSSSPKTTPLSSSPLSGSPRLNVPNKPAPVVPPIRTNSITPPTASQPPTPSLSSTKHQFSETGELKKKMNLVLDKIISMLPEESLTPKALKALENLASNQANIQHLVRASIMPHLIKTFAFNNEDINELSLNVLCQLCVYEDLSNQFVQLSGLVHIVRLMNSTNLGIAMSATKLLTALADEQNLKEIREVGGLKVLFVLLQSKNEFMQMQAVWAASRVLLDKINQYSFIEWGGIQMLLEMMNSNNQGLAMRALLAICCLITNEICQDLLLEAGVLGLLMNCLVSPSTLLRIHTLKIITNIGNQPEFRKLIVAENGISQIASQLGTSSEEENLLVLKCLNVLLAGDVDAIEQFNLSPCNAVDQLLSLFIRNQSTEILKYALTLLNHIIEHEPSRLKARKVIPFLVQQVSISETDITILIGCIQSLILFSQHASSIPIIQKTNIIEIITSLLRVNNISTKVKILQLVSAISKTGGTYLSIICNSDIIPILNDLLSSELNQMVKEQVISAISWLTASNECRDKFNQKNVLSTLINSISKSMNAELVERVLWSISFFCMDTVNQPTIRESHRVIDFIINCLGRSEEVLRTLAIKTILVLSQNEVNRPALVQAGIIPFLLSLGSSNNKPLQLASKKILSLLNN